MLPQFLLPILMANHQFTKLDYRDWGSPFWFQNTRLPYHNMLIAGDYDLAFSLYEFYKNLLPLAEARTLIYFNHSGAFFPGLSICKYCIDFLFCDCWVIVFHSQKRQCFLEFMHQVDGVMVVIEKNLIYQII